EAGRLRRLAELRDVGAGDEGPSGAGDDHGAHGRVGGRLLDAVVQPLAYVLAQRVDGGIADREDRDAAPAVQVDGLGDGCHGAPLLGMTRGAIIPPIRPTFGPLASRPAVGYVGTTGGCGAYC